MKKLSVIYWSCGGNIEVLANLIAERAEDKMQAEVKTVHVADASYKDIEEADVLAFGSPARDSTQIEQTQMQPFFDDLFENHKNSINGKKCMLFATRGWFGDDFMEMWRNSMEENGFEVIGCVSAKDSLTNEDKEHAGKLAEQLLD